MADKNGTKIYTARPIDNVRQTIERAIIMARAENSNIIVLLNDVRFGVGPNTTTKKALDTYLEVLDKKYKTEKQLKQNTK